MAKYTSEGLLYTAVRVANEAHQDQVDQQGQPYIFHPLIVASNCTDPVAQVVAVLHDVVEDNVYWNWYRLKQLFPGVIIEALECLTRLEEETYSDYIERVSKNRLATLVKLADLKHNLSRIEGLRQISPEKAESLYERYLPAQHTLLMAVYINRWLDDEPKTIS